MTNENFNTIVLRASEGNYITQRNEVEIIDRIIATVVCLGRNDSADNYVEIDKETADNYKAAKQEAIKAQIDAQNNE